MSPHMRDVKRGMYDAQGTRTMRQVSAAEQQGVQRRRAAEAAGKGGEGLSLCSRCDVLVGQPPPRGAKPVIVRREPRQASAGTWHWATVGMALGHCGHGTGPRQASAGTSLEGSAQRQHGSLPGYIGTPRHGLRLRHRSPPGLVSHQRCGCKNRIHADARACSIRYATMEHTTKQQAACAAQHTTRARKKDRTASNTCQLDSANSPRHASHAATHGGDSPQSCGGTGCDDVPPAARRCEPQTNER